MDTRLYWILIVTFFRSVAATIPVVFPRVGCWLRFGLFRFDGSNLERYNEYFRKDSVMILAETGKYTGPDAITEYVKFAFAKHSPYFQKSQLLHSRIRFAGYDRNTRQCEFLAFMDLQYELDRDTVGRKDSHSVVAMSKIYFDVKEKYIPTIHFFFTEAYFLQLFGSFFDSSAIRTFICNVYQGPTCGALLRKPKNCEEELQDLPLLNDGVRIDGSSQGCRVLHAAFARTNAHHCPHLSFVSMKDDDGAIKCQTSSDYSVDQLFDGNDMSLVERYMIQRGYDPTKGYKWEN